MAALPRHRRGPVSSPHAFFVFRDKSTGNSITLDQVCAGPHRYRTLPHKGTWRKSLRLALPTVHIHAQAARPPPREAQPLPDRGWKAVPRRELHVRSALVTPNQPSATIECLCGTVDNLSR